ncbi:MAG: sulfotransferase [Gaiellaceae bacterium]
MRVRRRIASHVPNRAKWEVRKVQAVWGRSTASLRMLPDFLIIGTQRGGTTSLYKYLAEHPQVRAPLLGKGAHYFSTGFGEGERVYRAHFPLRLFSRFHVRAEGRVITGEASPYYLFHPHVPRRVAEIVPRVRLVALLRDPVHRAYSHYWHEVERGFEPLTFEEAIEREQERLGLETERILADPTHESFKHRHYSYLARGLYADQLEGWKSVFPAEQMLVLSSEEFFADPETSFRRVLNFLELRPASRREYETFNPRDYPPMDEATRRRLADYFAEPNARLSLLLGVDFGWTR